MHNPTHSWLDEHDKCRPIHLVAGEKQECSIKYLENIFKSIFYLKLFSESILTMQDKDTVKKYPKTQDNI